ncbi:hypothetical protein BCR34DRAFT_577858 [Clohesyomyces aquaticus]|uniref:Carrier domain-containing protein n=1 Tax=Clohesyomyces aquaticus TaxID=1231657 RepID=A0A1Y1YIJ8_9PLEO|nr:hypothetical protein BCR34DRAFT_577858 [Clohesyomyces aquaticus]
MRPNYFVCTLGQAATLNTQPKPYQTISEFLTYQANTRGHLPAVGFPVSQDNQEWDSMVLSFRDVDRGADVVANKLIEIIGDALAKPQTVALLCHSSPEFLFTWLGLTKLGHSVLMIASQCQLSAIRHLCETCGVAVLLHDKTFSGQRNLEILGVETHYLPFGSDEDIFELIRQTPKPTKDNPRLGETAVAYLHHTSGTSSGLPKPIPQSHRSAIGILPHLPGEDSKATFTTTPLYHGGVADVFWAWTSDSLIWLFPGRSVPITARNICRCLGAADKTSSGNRYPPVKYFSSVPYVLQMVEADQRGLELLLGMDIVGIGGAALPAEVGNRLVKRGVNLISRFGSAECGFLLSSCRDFAQDKDWQYLRNENPSNLLGFEDHGDGLSELVVKPGWPHMAKTNRLDGSFRTADLFAPHPKISNAWSYHSRADAQLTLITGKKFDPAPLEATIATSPLLNDVYIFGTQRPFPGALLFRSKTSEDMIDDELLQKIKPVVQKLNDGSQDHARIPFNMLTPMPHLDIGLEKSSKGTIIRRSVEERFKDVINGAYETLDVMSEECIRDEDVQSRLMGLVKSIVATPQLLTEDTDLFSFGVDSIASMQLRNRLRWFLSASDTQDDLPLSIVEDCGTVRRLSDYILQRRQGESTANVEDDEKLMIELVKKYSSFATRSLGTPIPTNGHSKKARIGQTVIITGATGALGAQILDLLRRSENVTTIYCLVRDTDEKAATERVSKVLQQRGLDSLDPSIELNDKVIVLQAQLSDPQLSLTDSIYQKLASEADLILHVAWTVNFRLHLRSFIKDNIAGVLNLINLALKRSCRLPARFAFCSSTATMLNSPSLGFPSAPESILPNPSHTSPLGYARSKWVAEQTCLNAHKSTDLHNRIVVLRVGQLSGATESGIWNAKEAWPMLMSTMKITGCLPKLGEEVVDWLPVDVAAEAFLQGVEDMAGNHEDDNENGAGKGNGNGTGTGMRVYHILNPNTQPTWNSMLQWLQKKESFEIVPPGEWVGRLERCDQTEHPALKLLGMWKEAYCGDNGNTNGNGDSKSRARFDMQRTRERVPVLGDVGPLDEEYMGRIWEWVKGNLC